MDIVEQDKRNSNHIKDMCPKINPIYHQIFDTLTI